MGIEARERRRRVGAERSHRPARASPATGSGDDRPSEGPVFHAEPSRELRVQTVSHSPQQRGQLPGPHSGQAPPDQLGQTCRSRGQGRPRPTPTPQAQSHPSQNRFLFSPFSSFALSPFTKLTKRFVFLFCS